MKVTILLADYAQVADGKLFIAGGGWSLRGPNAPMALAVKIEVPWDQANEQHALAIELVDEDGGPAEVETPSGKQPILIEQTFEVGRPPGLPRGTPIDMPFAVFLGPLPLPQDKRFEWRLSIDGHHEEDWTVSFYTRKARPTG